jgi:hypothetical protein
MDNKKNTSSSNTSTIPSLVIAQQLPSVLNSSVTVEDDSLIPSYTSLNLAAYYLFRRAVPLELSNVDAVVTELCESFSAMNLDDAIHRFQTKTVFDNPLVEWLLNNTVVQSREEAILLLQQWLSSGLLQQRQRRDALPVLDELQQANQHFTLFLQVVALLSQTQTIHNPSISDSTVVPSASYNSSSSPKPTSPTPSATTSNPENKSTTTTASSVASPNTTDPSPPSTDPVPAGAHAFPQGYYLGTLLHNKRNGEGKMVYTQRGDMYDGEWRDDKYHGVGTYRWANGDCFWGSFVGGKRNGAGTLILRSLGCKYEGDFSDDQFGGVGLYIWPEGRMRYEGQWNANVMHGFGVMRLDNGQLYQGMWVNGLLQGIGEMFDAKSRANVSSGETETARAESIQESEQSQQQQPSPPSPSQQQTPPSPTSTVDDNEPQPQSSALSTDSAAERYVARGTWNANKLMSLMTEEAIGILCIAMVVFSNFQSSFLLFFFFFYQFWIVCGAIILVNFLILNAIYFSIICVDFHWLE